MSDEKDTADVVEEADRPVSAGADSSTPVAKNGKEKKYHIDKHAFTKGGSSE